MGSPYAHPILANVPEEDGRWANEFAMRAYEEYLGFRPESGWNPECTWRQYVPNTFRDVGYKYLTLDYESYKVSTDKEYGWVERNRGRNIYWGGHLPWYDLDPDDPALHRPFRDVVPGLDGMCRSDRLAGRSIGYFLGKTPLGDYVENVRHWSGTKGEGSLIIVADDAEYCGTRGYYDVKHYGDYSKCFGVVPEARRFDPQLDIIRNDYKAGVQAAAEADERYREMVERFWFHLTSAANSDGRWPPPPRKTSRHHREWVEREIVGAREALEELKRAVRADVAVTAQTPVASMAGAEVRADDGPMPDAAGLNWKELQDELYRAYQLWDATATAEEGRRRVEAIHEEYRRRGVHPGPPVF